MLFYSEFNGILPLFSVAILFIYPVNILVYLKSLDDVISENIGNYSLPNLSARMCATVLFQDLPLARCKIDDQSTNSSSTGNCI